MENRRTDENNKTLEIFLRWREPKISDGPSDQKEKEKSKILKQIQLFSKKIWTEASKSEILFRKENNHKRQLQRRHNNNLTKSYQSIHQKIHNV